MSDLYQIDLLKQRRQALGLGDPVLVDPHALLRQGVVYGSLAVGLVVLLLGWFSVRFWALQQTAKSLEPSSQQYQAMQQGLTAVNGQIESVDTTNKALVTEILSLPSSSALLQALVGVTPPKVQIASLSEKDGALVLKGQAADPMAFARIDVLMLRMARSPLFDSSSIVLVKADRSQGGGAAAATQGGLPQSQAGNPAVTSPSPAGLTLIQPAPSAGAPTSGGSGQLAQSQPAPTAAASQPAAVSFEIQAKFAKEVQEAPEKMVDVFLSLGAKGKALRVGQLRREGLLP